MTRTKSVVAIILLIIAGALAYLMLAPVAINPSSWTPPTAPTLTGQYERNTRLSPVQKLSVGDGHKPENVALDGAGGASVRFDVLSPVLRSRCESYKNNLPH